MTKLNLMFAFLFILPNMIFSQDFTTVKTKAGDVKLPGKWEQISKAEDTGQTYLHNKDGIIVAIAQNPKNVYSFFKVGKSGFESVTDFYNWDADYRKENKFKTDKLKEDAKQEYIIWKYNDGELDNVFLYGSSKANFLNLLVYTKAWTEDEKIKFLENLFKLNK